MTTNLNGSMINQKPKEISNVDNIERDKRVLTLIQKQFAAIKVVSKTDLEDLDEEELFGAMQKSTQEANDLLQAFGANDVLKAMLATQMAAIHDLQQSEFVFVRQSTNSQERSNHINAITKLSNVFIQQATLMQKLQGKGQQKVTVEHVHVHNGGQAIVGNVEASTRGGLEGGR